MVAGEYLRGLNWVMAYYYAGCASWTWYYPYFYAPLASDLITVPEGTAAPFALGASSRENAALHCMYPRPLVGLHSSASV